MKKITSRTDRTKLKTGLYLLDERSEITYYRIESDYHFIDGYYLAKEFVLGYNDDDIIPTSRIVKLKENDLIGMYIVGAHL